MWASKTVMLANTSLTTFYQNWAYQIHIFNSKNRLAANLT
jgi:hypothetical protein